ncbi:MAG: efflux RND transporter periplasmic adaptor subunit [Syntrophobacteraceae bacterium]
MQRLPSVVVVALLVLTAFLLGTWLGGQRSGKSDSPGRRVLYYVDPMNPAHTSTEAGPAPCGMPMEPVYADESAPNGQLSGPRHPGAVNITPQKQQLIGVRVDNVEKNPFTRTIRTSGLVALDEARIYRVNPSTGGWVREIYANTTGSMVMKDEPLFAFYSPTFLTAQQSYFYVLNTLDSMRQQQFDELERQNFTNVQLRTAVDNLRNLGVGDNQLRELTEHRQFLRNIIVGAPATGFVMARNLTLDQRFEPGGELYRIADLGNVWVLADIYKDDRQGIEPGQVVRIYSPDLGQEFEAMVSHVMPLFDSASRTAKVRLDVKNPETLLRPDMYVDVHFEVELPPTIHVPLDAVLDAGSRKTVFVDRGSGTFEPREVKTGWRFGDRIEVREGLMEGERIVVSGNFLIDSESRMKLAATGYYGEVAKDPVCRMYVDSERAALAGLIREHGGRVYHFCSHLCRGQFDKEPDRFTGKEGIREAASRVVDEEEGRRVGKPGTPPEGSQARHVHNTVPKKPAQDSKASEWDAARGFVRDAVCTMPILETNARQEGLVTEHAGKAYFFCSRECKQRFDKHPDGFLAHREGVHPAADATGHTEHQP